MRGEDRIVTADTIARTAEEMGREYTKTVKYLQQEGYITRVFRGVFYVNSLEERADSIQRRSVYHLVADALALKDVEQWYFALETALKMNDMTHEYFSTNYVMTDTYRTTKTIGIADQKFKFIKGAASHFGFGITTRDGLRRSDKEKTVLDRDRIAQYIVHYPPRVRAVVGDWP